MGRAACSAITRMSKGKYKRKRERTQKRARQKSTEPNPTLGEAAKAEHQRNATNAGDSTGDKKEKVSMSLPETLKRSSFSDWCLVAFTCALAVLGYFQYKTMTSQLDVMRNDERAWIEIKPTSKDQPQFIAGEKFVHSLTLSNIGKTPARNIRMKVFMDFVPSDQEVNLKCVEEGCPGNEVFYGIFFPTNTTFFPMERGNGATVEEATAWNNGSAYFAVFGILTYTDVFNTPHWSKFCAWYHGQDGFHYAATSCTAYNSVDDNQ
jgi:hypothetical protein